MKNTLLYISFFIIAIMSTACEDLGLIEPDPEDRITQEVALADLDGVASHVASGFNRLINFNLYGQEMMIMPDALADNVVVGNNTGRYVGESVNQARVHIDIYNTDITETTPRTVRDRYNAYSTINDVNIALETIELIRDENVARADILEGEARFIRALSYFDLLRVYAYSPGQEVDGFNLGVVLQTDAVFNTSGIEEQDRDTNLAGYELVESDLLAAINLLPGEGEIDDFPFRPSNLAARALLARVYLYWGRYGDAATQAQLVLSNTSANLLTEDEYLGSWSATEHPESIFELEVRLVDWNTVDGVNNSLATVTNTSDADRNLNNAQGAVRASPELIAAFEPNDIRRQLWVNPTDPNFFESRKWVGEQGDFRENIPLIRYSEVLLIAAEAKARSGNEAGGRTDLNTLRTNRGLPPTSASGQAFLDLVMNERRVELNLEGHRFFDFKRLGMDIPKPASAGFSALAYTDFRVLANISDEAISNNTVLTQNPGY